MLIFNSKAVWHLMKKVTHKMIVASLISFLVIMGLTFSILNVVTFHYIDRMEATHIEDAFANMSLILNREKEILHRTVLDWSHWDDTYFYIAGQNKAGYEEVNLQASTLQRLDLNFMYFLDGQGNVSNSIKRDFDPSIEKAFVSMLMTKSQPFLEFSNNHDVHTGLVSIEGIIYIITSSPITTTNEKMPHNGTLLLGRKLDDSLIRYINSINGAEVILNEQLKVKTEAQTTFKDEHFIRVSRPLKDINDNFLLRASLVIPRVDYKLGKYYLNLFALIFSVMLFLTFFIAIIVLNTHLLKRLTAIHEFIKNITKTKTTKDRLGIWGNDEISDIANSMNKMLSELEIAYQKSKESEDRIKALLEATDDGYLEYNLKTNEYYISPKWRLINTENFPDPSEITPLREYIKRIHPNFLGKVEEAFNELYSGKVDYMEIEYQLLNPSGELIWVLHKGKVTERDCTGLAIRIVGVVLNITARKKYEEKILKLSYYDTVTGLNNRVYMEEKLHEISTRQGLNYTIIIGDVNGLKLVNDTFGHKEGDRLISTIGRILQETCGIDDIVARWGGDEFIILAFDKEETYISGLLQNIKEKCAAISAFGFNISIALGKANNKELGDADAEDVMNLAEERMYRSKLTDVQSSRSATIASLECTLYEKNSETEEHTQRIKYLALKLGNKMQLSPDQLYELELLSLLHDIGKIGIPEHILMKPTKLNDEEWAIIKQHPEIGYRIAKSTPGLFHVAEEILYHHEKFDGTGYPQGLAGKSIPILSRIIAIVDSFDVMTHRRIYKDASTLEYAIEELKRCSGTQFDPAIVTEFLKLLEEEGMPEQPM